MIGLTVRLVVATVGLIVAGLLARVGQLDEAAAVGI